MAQAEGICYINELPDDWFADILDLVAISDVIADMRVSKRWTAACRYIIRTRQSVIIGNDDWYEEIACEMRDWEWHRNRPSGELDNIAVATESLVPLMMKSLIQMENITRLCVCGVSPENISPFIRKFAQQLTMLEVDIAISDVGSDVFPHLKHLKCRNFDAKSAAALPKLAELIIYGQKADEGLPDMLLPSLQKLMTVGCPANEQNKRFIIANRMNLEFLSADYFKLDEDESTDNNLKSFPAIRHLSLREIASVALLRSLPAAQLLGLDVRVSIEFDFEDEDEHEHGNGGGEEGDEFRQWCEKTRTASIRFEELQPYTRVIGEMSNLKELAIMCHFEHRRDRADPGLELTSMFAGLHQLEKVSISLYHMGTCLKADKIMDSLVQPNPNLRDVSFRGIEFSPAAYASLAQLHHLSIIFLGMDYCSNLADVIPTASVLALLRGSSRNVIRELTVLKKELDDDEVTREAELMAQERKTTFGKHESRFHIEYTIHAQENASRASGVMRSRRRCWTCRIPHQ